MSQSASTLASVLTSPPIMTNYLQASYFLGIFFWGRDSFLSCWIFLETTTQHDWLYPGRHTCVSLNNDWTLLIYVGYTLSHLLLIVFSYNPGKVWSAGVKWHSITIKSKGNACSQFWRTSWNYPFFWFQVNNNIINHPEEFTSKELDDVTSVFKSLETGLRQGTIFPKVSLIIWGAMC